jgi:hypothetical protein
MELRWARPTWQGDGRLLDNAFEGAHLIGYVTLLFSWNQPTVRKNYVGYYISRSSITCNQYIFSLKLLLLEFEYLSH